MIWQDVIVQRSLSDLELIAAIAAGLRVGPNGVLIHHGADDFPEPGGASVVCVVSDRDKGYKILLTLYTYFDPPREVDPVAFAKEFARVAQTECLLSDDSPDPYIVVRVLPSGDVLRATLDVDRLDDEDEYHVVAT